MPSKITARFFRVMPGTDNASTFKEALTFVHSVPIDNRRRKIVDGYEMRLESYSEMPNGLLKGDFTRIIRDDFPAVIEGNTLTALDADELGLCCAFLFDPNLSVLVFQYDPKKVSPNRAMAYLREFGTGNDFCLVPATNADAWKRFETGTVKRVKLRIAEPNDLAFTGGSALGDSVTGLSKAYGAPSILIEIGMGHHKGSLLGDLKRHVKSLFQTGDVSFLEVKTEEEGDAFSLLHDLLLHRDSIEIPSDPVASTDSRQAFLHQAYVDNKKHLKQMFGAGS